MQRPSADRRAAGLGGDLDRPGRNRRRAPPGHRAGPGGVPGQPHARRGRPAGPGTRLRLGPAARGQHLRHPGPPAPRRAGCAAGAAQRHQVPRRTRGRAGRRDRLRRGVRGQAAPGAVRHGRRAAPAGRLPAAARTVHPPRTGPGRLRQRRGTRPPPRRRPASNPRALSAHRRRDGLLRGARRPTRGHRRRPPDHPRRQPRQRRHPHPAPGVHQPPHRGRGRPTRRRGERQAAEDVSGIGGRRGPVVRSRPSAGTPL